MALTADDFDQLGAFLRERLEAARAQLPEDASLLRAETDGVRSAADDWETLKHIAHRWKDRPDYRV